MNKLRKKKMLLYGQWVEVTILPPQPSPIAPVTVKPKGTIGLDETAFESKKGQRRGRK